MMNRKLIGWSLVVLVALVALVWLLAAYGNTVPAGKWDTFAKCTADKGLIMYGAYWCPHCQKVKSYFGSSFEHISYVECTQDKLQCEQKGIKGYPTFILADGRRIGGEQTLEQLAAATGCPLTPDTVE